MEPQKLTIRTDSKTAIAMSQSTWQNSPLECM